MAGWRDRAAEAEQAVCGRQLRPLWALPRIRLGAVSWPLSVAGRLFVRWDYWWQAHLLDCLVDAYAREPTSRRRSAIGDVVRGIHLRNGWRWRNGYYDDVAWLGLALERAAVHADLDVTAPLNGITARLRDGWTDHAGGGIWWRVGDDYKNVPANGPAAILLARMAGSSHLSCADRTDLQRARSTVDWITAMLVDPQTGVVYDGLHAAPDGSVRAVERNVYTYCQGVYVGACVELAEVDGAPRWARQAARTIDAVVSWMTTPTTYGLVVRGQGGGDGGLFAGILVRYLAQAALALPDPVAARTAAGLVYGTADAAWENRAHGDSGPLFGDEWSRPQVPSADLSVQLSAWMALEAAAMLADSEVADPR